MSLKFAGRGLALVLAVAVFAGTTVARGDLANETDINEGLIVIAMAKEIGDQCPTLDARRLQGINYFWGLVELARERGYSDAEIRAYGDDPVQKERLMQVALQRFANMGGVVGNTESYCEVGRAEIARGTAIGQLLR
jgi:hypothetical protein